MARLSRGPFRIAAVQAAPVFLDRAATVDKACELIAQVGAEGAKLAVFPEAFIPTYPFWVWFIPAGQTAALRELYTDLLDGAVTVPGPVTDRLCDAARAAGVNVAIGVNERNDEASGGTLFNTLLIISSDGRILGRHRKLVPTAGERLCHGRGDGSTLHTLETDAGRLAGLICWENYMPLARFALYADGAQIWAAPTWDRGEPWLSTLRHIAKEGRVYVVGCCSAVRKSDVPDRYDFKERFMGGVGEWVNPGDSVIVDPDGKLLAGPVSNEESILFAEVDPARMKGPRFQLDVAGHYGRPDIFDLQVDRTPRPVVQEIALRAEAERAGGTTGE
jgi:nitrilase